MTGTGAPDVADSLIAVLARHLSYPVSYAQLPQRLTGGRDADVFALQLAGATDALAAPLVLRLFRPHDTARAHFEAEAHRVLSSLGYAVPDVYLEAEFPDGCPCFLMGRIPGKPAASFLVPPTLTALKVAQLLASAHVALHELPAAPVDAVLSPLAPRSLRPLESLALRLERLEDQGDQRFRAVNDWLIANAPGNPPEVICHADFHPMNVMIHDARVSGVIDWTNIQLAPAEYDVARTVLTVVDGPVDLPGYLTPVAGVVRRWLASRYLANYRAQRALDADLLRFYTALAAVVMLVEAAQAALVGRGHAWLVPRPARRLAAHIADVTAIQSDHLVTTIAAKVEAA